MEGIYRGQNICKNIYIREARLEVVGERKEESDLLNLIKIKKNP